MPPLNNHIKPSKEKLIIKGFTAKMINHPIKT